LNARIQQLTWSLIFYEKYSTSLSTIVLVVFTTANFGGFSNFCRYYTRSQTGKSTRYRLTLKPLPMTSIFFCSSLWQVCKLFAQAYDKYVFFLSVLHMFWWKCSLVYVYIFYISKDVKKKKKRAECSCFQTVHLATHISCFAFEVRLLSEIHSHKTNKQ
jgi:hypothetical protein